MSRLDSMLRRLTAQRDGLNWAAAHIADTSGDVIEIGLGNGRTYDHLRSHLPGRQIWVVDRQLQCHASCVPPQSDFLQGEAADMLEHLAQQNIKIALAHYDLGTGVADFDEKMATRLSPLLREILAPGGLILSDQPLFGFDQLPEPEGIPNGRYMFYRGH